MVQHYLFMNQHEYIKHYAGNKQESDYLRRDALGHAGIDTGPFEKYYQQVSARLKAAGIPLYVVLLPSHAQVSLISGAAGNFTELSPLLLDEAIRSIVQAHDDTYIDVFDNFKDVSNPGQYFYAIDEHMNESGHELVAGFMANELLADSSFRQRLSGTGSGTARKVR